MNELLNEISEALQKGKHKLIVELVSRALEENIGAMEILEKGLFAGMDVVGEKFSRNEIFVSEMMIAARAMSAATALLKDALTEAGAEPIGKALIGTVKGDMHDIGKNLVRMMLEGKGIEVIDLGIDVPHEKFLEAYRAENPDVICLSALLTTTKNEMKNTVDLFVKAGERENVTIMVGGAPVTDAFRESIGADIYTPDAGSAAEAAKEAILRKRNA